MSCAQSGPQGAEKRGAFRCRVPGSRRDSVLRVGKKQIPVQVLDESAGGFAVLVNRHPGVGPDDVVRLCTESGWHEVRVVHVCKHEPAISVGSGNGQNQARQFRIGLERLRDLATWEANRGFRAWFDRLRIGGFLPLGSSTVVVGVVIAVSAASVLAAGTVVLKHIGDFGPTPNKAVSRRVNSSPRAESTSRSYRRVSQGPSTLDRGDPTGTEPTPPSDSSRDHPTGAFGSDSLVERSSPTALSGTADDSPPLVDTIRRLPGASPFGLKEVARELGLSQEQQEEIQRIIELSSEAIRQIRVRWPNQTRQQHDQKRRILLDEARRRVLELLTEEQRARWEALQGGTTD